MSHYDLIVIGAGSGNSILDEAFADRRCALITTGAFGGTCLNVGCIPTKMFVYPADLAGHAAHDGPRLGVATRFEGADWPAIRDRVFGRIDAIEAAGREYRRRGEWADLYEGRARFTAPHTLTVALDEGGEATLTGDQIVIATGSSVSVPAIPGLASVPFHTSDTVMRLDRLPERVGILGGGFVGCEFAHVFHALGSEVTQIHRHPALLNRHDAEIAHRYTEAVGWRTLLDSGVASVAATGSGIAIEVTGAGAGTVEVDTLLVAAGRHPNTDLGLEVLGIDLTDAGTIPVDEFQRTSAPGVWALGDVTTTPELKHVANREARVVRHNLLHPDAMVAADHRFVPSAVFTHPQIASVGLTEEQAVAAGHDVAVAHQDYGGTAYGWAMEDTTHFAKLIGDRRTGMLLGAHLMGPHASSLIQPLIAAMSFDQPVAGLAAGQYWIHPALSEVVENALLALERELTPAGSP